jgi:hypothetical protein
MNEEISTPKSADDGDDDIVSNEFSEDTVVLVDVADDDVADQSAELDVSRLVAKLDSKDATDIERKREIHRRLEELQDQKETEENIDSTFNFNLDDDL